MENPSIKGWSETVHSHAYPTPPSLHSLREEAPRSIPFHPCPAVLAWFKITSSSSTFTNTNLVGIPLILHKRSISINWGITCLENYVCSTVGCCVNYKLKECSNSRSVHSSDDYWCFRPILTKVFEGCLWSRHSPSPPLAVRNLSEYIPYVLRMNRWGFADPQKLKMEVLVLNNSQNSAINLYNQAEALLKVKW